VGIVTVRCKERRKGMTAPSNSPKGRESKTENDMTSTLWGIEGAVILGGIWKGLSHC